MGIKDTSTTIPCSSRVDCSDVAVYF